jgi:hypothetical protein
MALQLPKFSLRRPGGGIMAMLAGGFVGRLLAPLTPVLVFLGLRDRSSKFILNIGDEGSTLVQIQGGQVTDAVFAEASNEDGWLALREMLSTDPAAPIVVVADVLEQMFREDTVPKVGIFDRSKIVKRRLDLTFPNEVLKAALPFARKRGAPQAVLFTALPMSPHLERWVAFLDEFPNQVRGFYMLPLEAVGVAGKLAPPAVGETRKVWRALISQEAASGFRQVFDLGGKMIVTRLTQKASQPLTPDAEAMLIERELRSSISYVKRLGFSDADRLDVVLLADPAVCRAVDERELPATTVTAFTPYQAGVMLGLGEVGREDSPFADILLGLWVAAKRRPLLTLPTKKILAQLKMTSIIRWSAAATAVLTLLAIYYTGSLISAFAASGEDLDKLQSDLAKANATLEAEKDRMKNYPIPLEELTAVAGSQDRLQAQEIDFVALMRKVSGALGQEARATSIIFETTKPADVPKPAAARKSGTGEPELPPVAYTITLKVKLAKTSSGDETQAAVQEAKTVLARLGDALPGLTVRASQLPDNTMGNQVIEGSADTVQKQAPAGHVQTAEFTIHRDK